MQYSDLGEARILKPVKSKVQMASRASEQPAAPNTDGWVSLGDAMISFLSAPSSLHQSQKNS